jgi:hypothetical protein
MSAAGPAEKNQRDHGAGGAAEDQGEVPCAKKVDWKADQGAHAGADHGNHDSLDHYLMLSDGGLQQRAT